MGVIFQINKINKCTRNIDLVKNYLIMWIERPQGAATDVEIPV